MSQNTNSVPVPIDLLEDLFHYLSGAGDAGDEDFDTMYDKLAALIGVKKVEAIESALPTVLVTNADWIGGDFFADVQP